jgi:hypothetical protein
MPNDILNSRKLVETSTNQKARENLEQCSIHLEGYLNRSGLKSWLRNDAAEYIEF